MRLIRLGSLVDGMVLGQDLRTGRPNDAPLLRAGVTLATHYVDRLRAMGIHTLWIEDDLSEGIAPLPPLDPETRRQCETEVTESFERIGRTLASGHQAIPARELATLTQVASDIASSLADSPEASLALNDLATADAYTHRHSVQVAIIGMLIARRHWSRRGWIDYHGQRRSDRIEQRLTTLGVGLIVHDIGKLAVPLEILNKPGRLTDEEMAVMQQHPKAGVDLLAPARPSPLTIAAVRDHHERLDGSGYPAGRRGDKIHQFARICAIADVYDAVSSERPYKPAMPPYKAINVIAAGTRRGGFDAELAETFQAVCLPFPIGSEVDIEDDRTGVVCAIDEHQPWMPTVRYREGGGIEQTVLDLRHLAEPFTAEPLRQAA